MRLVPTTGPLEIQAYVTNDDIGFVSPGQTAEVKIDSFPFARFGTIGATVTSLAYDAIPADAADRVIIDAARQDDPASHTFAPNAKAMSDLVFAARLTPARLTMNVDGHKALLAVGMTVSVEIRTGKRRILSYLFSPLVDVASNALGER
jgi:hemolysin D